MKQNFVDKNGQTISQNLNYINNSNLKNTLAHLANIYRLVLLSREYEIN